MRLTHLATPQEAKQWCEEKRLSDRAIGFVATMGALHEGHLTLIRAAKEQNDLVVVSIFVNPLQFDNPEDLAKYPKELESDLALLSQEGVAMAFTGEIDDFYQDVNSLKELQLKDPGIYAQGMEGAYRPGHFEGVREIVYRLFSFVGQCTAYFGEKDFQQLQIIKQLADEMGGVKVVTCPTSREPTGLARSSRNARLSESGKQQAGVIHQALSAARAAWQLNERLAPALQQEIISVLIDSGFKWEYVEVVDPDNWTATTPSGALSHARALIAMQIEDVRLIDNMLVGREEAS